MPVKVVWIPECQLAFDVLKAKLVEAPILMAPNFQKPFVVQRDASEYGIGAVLIQEVDDGMLHPVSFFSKKLFPQEKSFSVPEKECLSVVWALNKLCPYLWG